LRLREVVGPLPSDIAEPFDRFEAEFTYPLGPGRTFRISHERDPHRFFAAMGEAVSILAEEDGRVVGSGSIASRVLIGPDGEERTVAYIGDLKVALSARGGRTLLRLARAIEAWGRQRTGSAFSVVMDGTRLTPADYTGRAGIAAFEEIAKAVILRVSAGGQRSAGPRPVEATRDDILGIFRRWSRGNAAVLPGEPPRRSVMEPCWLALAGGEACGCVEDTRRAKRLFSEDGSELSSAHLTAFAFAKPRDGAALISAASALARERGFDALFVAASATDAPALGEELAPAEIVVAPATIYGAGLWRGRSWNINTSEI
jgi:hypothetical protein